MRGFWIKAVNLLMAVALMAGYNGVLEMRAKEDEIARLTAELAGSKLTAQANAEVKTSAGQKDSAEEGEEASGLKDGTFEGEAEGFGGPVRVEVTVAGGKIADVQVTEAKGEDSAYLGMAEDITEDIVEQQSADVDTISGATFSSTGIREAAALAIEKAEE